MGNLERIATALMRLTGLDVPEPENLFDHTAEEWDALASDKAREASHLHWEATSDQRSSARPSATCERRAAEACELARTYRRNAALIRCGRFA
jgi:hypothetical protein